MTSVKEVMSLIERTSAYAMQLARSQADIDSLREQLKASEEQLVMAHEEMATTAQLIVERDQLREQLRKMQEPVSKRVAQLIAHRACINEEHDPVNGKLAGFCAVCGIPWPCETARAAKEKEGE